jgi:uncharacterized protein
MEALSPEASDLLDPLYGKVDAFFAAAVEAQAHAFRCDLGCDTCCRQDLSVLPVEAARVRSGFERLPQAAREAVQGRARASEICVFRDPMTGACVVYEDRPLICRSHGLAVLVDDVLDHCPLNFAQVAPAPAGILALERVNEPLIVMNRLAGFGGQRVLLSALALEDSGHEESSNGP